MRDFHQRGHDNDDLQTQALITATARAQLRFARWQQTGGSSSQRARPTEGPTVTRSLTEILGAMS